MKPSKTMLDFGQFMKGCSSCSSTVDLWRWGLIHTQAWVSWCHCISPLVNWPKVNERKSPSLLGHLNQRTIEKWAIFQDNKLLNYQRVVDAEKCPRLWKSMWFVVSPPLGEISSGWGKSRRRQSPRLWRAAEGWSQGETEPVDSTFSWWSQQDIQMNSHSRIACRCPAADCLLEILSYQSGIYLISIGNIIPKWSYHFSASLAKAPIAYPPRCRLVAETSTRRRNPQVTWFDWGNAGNAWYRSGKTPLCNYNGLKWLEMSIVICQCKKSILISINWVFS